MIRGKIQTGNHYGTVAEIYNSLKEINIFENIVKRGTFCRKHSEKGTCFFCFVFFIYIYILCMFLNPLFMHRYQADLEAPPTPPPLSPDAVRHCKFSFKACGVFQECRTEFLSEFVHFMCHGVASHHIRFGFHYLKSFI